MEDLLVCRMCLSTNVKLYDMYTNRLVLPYETLTGLKVSKLDQFSHKACGVCSTLILKCISFKNLCQSSQDLIHFAKKHNHVVTTEYIQSLDLKTHALCNLNIDTIKYEYIPSNDDIKPENSNSNNTEFLWKTSCSDEEPLKEREKKTRIKDEINEVQEIKEEENYIFELPANDDDDSDNNVQETFEGVEVDLVILSKEQQIEELHARKSTLNYLHSFYKCDKCFKGFMTDLTYKNHMARHDPSNGPFKCDICQTYWSNISSLHSHSASSHERKYICRLCSHVSKSRHSAKEHFKWHNGHIFACKICGALFEKSTSHLTHLRLQHPSEHSCDICGESFVSVNGLKMHKKKAHRSDQNNKSKEDCVCSICDTQFQSLEALRIHTEDNENGCTNVSACVHCGENFKSENHLKEHLKMHSKDESTKCEECDRPFANERAYALHYKRVHLGIKYKHKGGVIRKSLFVCETCGKKCFTKSTLMYHQRIHTGEKPYECKQCPKKFSVHQRLQIHLRIHTGESPYKCSHCPKAFKHKAALNRHVRVHTGEKPYSCSHCGKCFSQSNSMKIHVKTVHLKMPAPYRSRQSQLEKSPT